MFAPYPILFRKLKVQPPFTEEEIQEMSLIMTADVPDEFAPWGHARVWFSLRTKDCGCNLCTRYCKHLHKWLKEGLGQNIMTLKNYKESCYGHNLMDKLPSNSFQW